MKTQNYSWGLHGLHVEASGPQALIEPVARRFCEFPQTQPGEPDLRFEFQIVTPAAAHLFERPAEFGRTFYVPNAGEATYFPAKDLCYLEHCPHLRVLCDPTAGTCAVSINEAEPDNLWLATHPLFTLPLLEMLKRRGKYSLHAAGVSRAGRSLLVPGSSGAGKSTLTVALLQAGFDLIGDDLAFLTANHQIEALAFPEQIDLCEDTFSLFPELLTKGPALKQEGWPKLQVSAGTLFSSKVAWRTVPVAIVFPKVTKTEQSFLVPLSSSEAFLELSKCVLLTDRESTRCHLAILAELTRNLPAYRLFTGLDFNHIASLLSGLLR